MRPLTALAADAEPDFTFRLDPFALPVRAAERGATTPAFVLDRERAVLRRRSRAGIDMTLAVPISAYAGISVRVVPTSAPSDIAVMVELCHSDPALTLPLALADDPDDAAADWQAWSRILNLPLLVIEPDGTVRQTSARIGALTVAPAKPRGRVSFLKGRRSRFLRRRKTGRTGVAELLTGREIIARN